MHKIISRWKCMGSGMLLAALALGCSSGSVGSGPGSSEVVSGTGEALTAGLTGTPTDPVAYCRGLTGFNVIIGTPNNDVLNGTTGNDCIVGLGGQDVINAGGGNDIVFGGDGDDSIVGAAGNDQLFGGNGQDGIDGGDGNDMLFGEAGDDRVVGGAGDDQLDGGQGQDQLSGDAGNDTLSGGQGGDRLNGGDGNDNLSDCQDHNQFDGGAGTNNCTGDSGVSPNSSTFTNCIVQNGCASSVNIGLINDIGTYIRGQGVRDELAILDAADQTLTPFLKSVREALRLVIANADLIRDPATLTPAQLARLPAFRAALEGSVAIRTLTARGQGLIADPAALNAAIGSAAARTAAANSPIPPPPGQSCGAPPSSIFQDSNRLITSSNFQSNVNSFITTANTNRASLIAQLQSGVVPAANAALFLPFSDLQNLTPVGSVPGAIPVFSLGGFLAGVGEAALGAAGVVVGAAAVVVGVATGNPALVAGGVVGIAAGGAFLLQGIHDVGTSFDGGPSCPFAITQCILGCAEGTDCVEGCCLAPPGSGSTSGALISAGIVKCGNTNDCSTGFFCNTSGCCERTIVK